MDNVRRLSSNYEETIRKFCENYKCDKSNGDKTILANFLSYTATNSILFDCNKDKVYSDIISKMFISGE